VHRSTTQNVALSGGVFLLAITCIAELIGWGESGFGALQMFLLVIGFALLAIGVLPSDAAMGRILRQLILLFGAAYFSLLLAEVGLLVVTPYDARIDPVLSLRGSVVETPWGFGLTPGWRGVFDDGLIKATIQVNARGDRDAETPRNGARQRVLLIGDSVAFGYGLDQEETIDAQLEQMADGVDAHNLGVLGYGPAETAAKLRATTSTTASHVIYVFNGNDLRDDARPGNYRVWNGYLVPTMRPDGSPYTEADYREHAQAKADDTTLRKVLSLVGTRDLMARILQPDADRVMGPLDNYKPEGIERALEQTAAMKKIAEARGAKFTVVVVPMKGEAAPESYAAPTRQFLDRLAAASIPSVDLHGRLNVREHYFDHDPHLNEVGANQTAKAIAELLEKR
jgi:hypothetical protein